MRTTLFAHPKIIEQGKKIRLVTIHRLIIKIGKEIRVTILCTLYTVNIFRK